MNKCVLKIIDEVNIKFVGLDVPTRRKLVSKLKYFVPQAFHMPAYKLGRWDGTISFCTLGGASYFNLLDDLLPIVIEDGYEIEIEDLRQEYSFEFPVITDQYLSEEGCRWPKGHPSEGQPILLRDYQVEIINSFLQNTQSIQEAATGAGKTIITATLSRVIETYGKTIVIVPNKSLVVQTEEDYRNIGLDVGVYYGERKELDKTHTICTWQSLEALQRTTKKKGITEDVLELFAQDILCVIVDECFTGDTLIYTPTGYKRLDSLKEGDIIINYSEENKKFKNDVVEKVHVNLPKSFGEDLYELEFDNDIIIRVTGNHKVLTINGWKMVKDLELTDSIINIYDNM